MGVRLSPWMTATMRAEFGVDIHDHDGWVSAALHSLPTRNLYRLYRGGGLDLIFDAHDELRPLLRIRNYYAFLAGGWELQLLENQAARFEISYHQGTRHEFIRGTLGYSIYF